MDGSRFDAAIRAIGARSSRRTTIRGAVAGLAGLVGGTMLQSAEAKPKKCKKNEQRCGNKCIKKSQCCKNSDCPGNQKCKNKKCKCAGGSKLCGKQCIPNADPCVRAVSPGNLRQWNPIGEDPSSSYPLLTTFVDGGPGTVPQPSTASLKLQPQAFGIYPVGQTQAVFRNLSYAGTPLSKITALGYDSYVPAADGEPVTFQVSLRGAESTENDGFVTMVYVPGQGTNPVPAVDTWTTENPFEGQWWFTRDICDAAGTTCVFRRLNGSSPAGSCCLGNNSAPQFATWTEFLAANPDAYINGEQSDDGGISLRRGRDNGDTGYAANIVINDTLFAISADD